MFLPLLLAALLLTSCVGGAADLSGVTPPDSTTITTTGNAKVDKVLQEWQAGVPQAMQDHQVKADTITQVTYTTGKSLDEVKSYYDTTFTSEKGWRASTRTPGLDAAQGVLISGYDHGVTSLVVGAVDQSKYGGEGVVVYTATGHK